MSAADIATGRQLRIDIDRASATELRTELRRIAAVYREACTLSDLSARDGGYSVAYAEQRDRLSVSIALSRDEPVHVPPRTIAHLTRPLVEYGDPPAPTDAPTDAPTTTTTITTEGAS